MIKIKNISFSFDKEIIIHDLSLDLDEGKTYCIMGKSGVGKTTLLKLISGIIKCNSGEILGTEKLKKSFIFQENRLLPWLSIYENIKYITNDESRIIKSLNDTSLLSEKAKKPAELSGGMARRATIARAAAADGDIFFIDEPLYGLDIKTSQGILELIKNIVKDKTAFIITHSPEEAFFLADKIIFLDNKPISKAEVADVSQFASSESIRIRILSS